MSDVGTIKKMVGTTNGIEGVIVIILLVILYYVKTSMQKQPAPAIPLHVSPVPSMTSVAPVSENTLSIFQNQNTAAQVN